MSEAKFTGVWIPSEVLQLETLSITEKVVYGIISALDNEDGCYASNGYIARTLQLSDRQVKNVLKTLIDYNLVKRIEIYGKRILRTVEKQALVGVIDYQGKGNELPRGRKSTSHRGGNKLPTDRTVDNIEDNKDIILPYDSQEFRDSWDKWIKYRKQIKKPLAPFTQMEQLRMLESWNSESKSIASINKSIAFGWQGLFTVKEEQSKTLTNKDHANGF
jgi:hypothetical protein